MSTICCMLHLFGNGFGQNGSTLYIGAFCACGVVPAAASNRSPLTAMVRINRPLDVMQSPPAQTIPEPRTKRTENRQEVYYGGDYASFTFPPANRSHGAGCRPPRRLGARTEWRPGLERKSRGSAPRREPHSRASPGTHQRREVCREPATQELLGQGGARHAVGAGADRV